MKLLRKEEIRGLEHNLGGLWLFEVEAGEKDVEELKTNQNIKEITIDKNQVVFLSKKKFILGV